MDVAKYLEQRRRREDETPKFRELCLRCRQPAFGCFCAHVKPFDPGMDFVILLHPIELKRRIATGRMSHLCLRGSHLITGHDYTDDARVNAILADPRAHCVMLYPGRNSLNLTEAGGDERARLAPTGKRLTVFVVDGTWATARQTVRLSRNLHAIPRVCFTPPGPSNFRVRKQPREGCYSTIEAVHHFIDLLGTAGASRPHDNLLEVFDVMVERQLKCLAGPQKIRRVANRVV